MTAFAYAVYGLFLTDAGVKTRATSLVASGTATLKSV